MRRTAIEGNTARNLKEYVMTGLAFSIQGRIASIVFDRPNEQNLLSRDLLLELRTIATDLASNHELQVLTLTGEGTECFSTGILTPALRGQLEGSGPEFNPAGQRDLRCDRSL